MTNRLFSTRPAEAGISEDQFYALRAQMDRIGEAELVRFRNAPENRVLLQQFDAYARRQAMPYVVAMLAVLVTSLAAAWLLM